MHECSPRLGVDSEGGQREIEVVIVLNMCPITSPLESTVGKSLVTNFSRSNHTRMFCIPVDVHMPFGRQATIPHHVGVLDGVDVDCNPIAMLGPTARMTGQGFFAHLLS